MALTKVEIDERNKIVRTAYGGETTSCDLIQGNSLVKRFIESHGLYSGITDFSAVTKFTVTGAEMRGLAFLKPAIPAERPKVVIAPTDITYGMSRMFQLLCDQSRPRLFVVRNWYEAYELLRTTTPDFSGMIITKVLA